MKQYVIVRRHWLPVALGVLLLAACAPAQDGMGYVNVKDFGAKGDGKTDDTAAIRSAFGAVRAQTVAAGFVNNVTGDTVLFPPGVYRVTDSIKIGGSSMILGRGKPCIVMEDPSKDIITTTDAWRMDIRGLQFKGGRTQLDLRNPNLDTGMIVIEDCRFHEANGPAIDDHMVSTIVHIRNCHFLINEQVLRARTDMVAMRDCWITTRPDVADKAVIENYTHLLLENICGVPLAGRNLRWIDNHGGALTARRVRFGGEGGGGFTPVYNYTKPSKEMAGTRILLDNAELWNQGNLKAPCAVYCIEVPNKIEIRSSNLAGIRPILVRPDLDLKTYFTGVDPALLNFVSRDNLGAFHDEVPELLKNPVCPPEARQSSMPKEETDRRLKAAVVRVAAIKAGDPGPQTFEKHPQKTGPADYIELSPDKFRWDLEDCMDGSKTRNSHYLAMAPAGDDVVIMKRVAGEYPHVLIRDVKVDLDKTPWLTWKQKDVGTPEGFAMNPAGYAVRVIHKESGTSILLREQHWPPFFDYCAFNLKGKFGLKGGIHTFDIRFYYLGLNFVATDKCEAARPGDFIAIDFLRLEKP